MNSMVNLHYRNTSCEESVPKNNACTITLKFSVKNKRKILKVFLLERLHQLFSELFHKKFQHNQNSSLMECYEMDSKIIRLLIHGIVETGEYTLEGIAHYTRIPFDVVFDAACGINNQFSITPWSRIVSLYLQVKPDIAQVLFDKLIEMKDKNYSALLLLLNEA